MPPCLPTITIVANAWHHGSSVVKIAYYLQNAAQRSTSLPTALMQPLEEDPLCMDQEQMILLLMLSGALNLAVTRLLRPGAVVDVKTIKALWILVVEK